MRIRALSEHRCHLGEGPLWDQQEQALFWVDSYGPTLYRYASDSGQTELWQLPGRQVGSIALRERGGLILAASYFGILSGVTGKTYRLPDQRWGKGARPARVSRTPGALTA